MTARPQPNLAIQPQVGSEIGNAHAGQLVSGSGNVHAGQLGRLHKIEKANSAKAPANSLDKSTTRLFSTDNTLVNQRRMQYQWETSREIQANLVPAPSV
ncbi:hypothetical protein H4Q26_005573 [Puccinia striiformis f. sp. tritici PST-130]|nr:hypothetical protein H4Q26_005573 [Puccinia striiformis f. sp. tritici PST-130]